MMHIFVNALAASAGGGLTYIRNVLPRMCRRSSLKITVAVSPQLRDELRSLDKVDFVELHASTLKRFWYEQFSLPEAIRKSGADVLLSTGNFAVRKSPVPQILLSRNSLYVSSDFYRDLLQRHEYRMWLDTHARASFAKSSIRWADVTVAPSRAFASELARWSGREVLGIYHGFDYETFSSPSGALTNDTEAKLRAAESSFKLLFVSHYNYYRNFETLLKSLPLLRARLNGRDFKLLLTCQLAPGSRPGGYDPAQSAALVRELGLKGAVVELGPIPYQQLHRIYSRADVYVTPAYAETFAHPLVEAMASNLPVVASDLEVHREICGDAALYFPKFSPESMANTLAQVLLNPNEAKQMSSRGLIRSRIFSWENHVEEILQLSQSLIARGQTVAAE